MFSEYMTKLSAVRKLTPEEERALWRAYKEEGDESARRRIIEAYQPLVFREVMPYRTMPAVMDAVQEGTIGLIEAVERYDPMRGVAFSLYAVHRVRGRILDFLRREGSVDLPCLEAETEAQETAKELLVDEQASVAELAEHHALVDVLGAVMERLPLRERRYACPYLSSAAERHSPRARNAFTFYPTLEGLIILGLHFIRDFLNPSYGV